MERADFSPDGRQVVTVSWGRTFRTTQVWDLSPDARPRADLVRLAQLLAGGYRINDTGVVVPLPPAELKALWKDLRARYPADFTVAPAAARTWRQQQIRDCMNEGNLAAAEFHQWWLVAELATGLAK